MNTRNILLAVSIMTAAAHSFGATFGDDLSFLKNHIRVIVLSSADSLAQVALVPAWQGRVMTSTAGGEGGLSFGWLNRELIAAGKSQPHFNPLGGEDRFWLGPEGGQFSIFFAKGVAFDLDHWFTPAPVDTMPYEVANQSKSAAEFRAEFSVTNYSGTRFDVKVNREVRLLTTTTAWTRLSVKSADIIKSAASVKLVGFETVNRITNTGKAPWKKDTGLLSIWILGMFTPSAATTIVVPIKPGSESELGTRVTSDYFGAVPAERLVVRDRVIFFSGDGRFRSKIGVSPKRSLGVLGSYDAANKVLTIVQFTQPAGVTDYVNSLWKIQDNPFGGDAANSYNDGPPAPGAKPLGPFCELESSSPAAALAPGKSLEHVHRTIHLSGDEAALDAVARARLGVSLAEIKSALPR